jgi:hypothetical protein
VALKQFLADPDRFASGTSMPLRGLTPQQIDEVVATLERLDEAFRYRLGKAEVGAGDAETPSGLDSTSLRTGFRFRPKEPVSTSCHRDG